MALPYPPESNELTHGPTGGLWPLIFIHIPRTGGTSLVGALREAIPEGAFQCDYGSRALQTTPLVREEVYAGAEALSPDGLRQLNREGHATGKMPPAPVEPSSEGRRRVVERLSGSEPTVICGHFLAGAYAFARGRARFATFVRDPVERVLSQYGFVTKQGWFDGPVEEYVELPNCENVQTTFLDGLSAGEIDFIGLRERFGESVALLNGLTGLDLTPGHEFRTNWAARNEVPQPVRREIERRNAADIELYAEARRVFEERLRASARAQVPVLSGGATEGRGEGGQPHGAAAPERRRSARDGRRLLVAGYYGFGNTGDEAILEGILSDLEAVAPGLELTVVSGDPSRTSESHGVGACFWKDLAAVTREVERSDLVLVGGGGLFHDYWGFDPETMLTSRPDGLAFWCGVSLLASLAGKPLMIYGVGVGPLFSDEAKRHVRMVFEQAAAATVRDPESRDLLVGIGVDPDTVEVAADPACGLQRPAPELSRELRSRVAAGAAGPLVVVALRHWARSVPVETWCPKVAWALDRFLEQAGGRVVFVPFQSAERDKRTADLGPTRLVRDAMTRKGETILAEDALDHRQIRALIASADLVLGMRLHSLVFALTSGVPAVGLSYDPKVASFMRQMGCSELCVTMEDLEPSSLGERLLGAWKSRSDWKAVAEEKACLASASARRSAQAAIGALSSARGGAAREPAPELVALVRRLALRQTRFRANVEASGEARPRTTPASGSAPRGGMDGTGWSGRRPLVSYIVVTYGNLELTKACLGSLLVSETWPRLEVVVVDNGSRDGTPEYLDGLAARDSRVRAILNQENRGFAAANNQGLRRAAGDVLILLNNDTVVPPGTTGRLAGHLAKDRSIGLVCSTTNYCGNEAKVEPDYVDLADLSRYADRRAAEHEGKAFDIGVAAMYCVALRRDTLEAVGPLDEGFGLGLFEDDDYSHRVREAGRRVVCAEDAYVHHVGQATFRGLTQEEFSRLWRTNQAYYEKKWGRKWAPHARRAGISAPPSKFGRSGSAKGPGPAYDVVCFSIINWEFRWQRPQQIMAAWARRGRRVFFLRITDFLSPGRERIAVRALADNVWEVRMALPGPFAIYSGKHPEGFVAAGLEALRALTKRFSLSKAVGVVQHASWTPLASAAREAFGWSLVYDCMDDWSTFPGTSQRPAVLAWEGRLVKAADVVVVSSRTLQQRWAKERPDTLLAQNAADFDFFQGATGEDPLPDVEGPIAGYFGALAEWLDLDLLVHVAAARPAVTFVLVGGIHRISVEELERLPNVRLEHLQPYEKIPLYLRRFDACLIPFVVSPVTHGVDPVKFYEYVSQGKPVVTTRFREILPYAELLYLAADKDDFVRQLDRALSEDDATIRVRRVEFARQNTWSGRLDRIEEAVGKTLSGPRRAPAAARPPSPPSMSEPAALRGEAEKWRGEAQALRAELARLHASRAWRLASLYWRGQRFLGRVARRARSIVAAGRH